MDPNTAIADRKAIITAGQRTTTDVEVVAAHDYDLVIEPRDGYLYARLLTTAMVPEVYQKVFRDIRYALHDHEAPGLMFEYETPFPLGEEKIFQFISNFLEIIPEMPTAWVVQHQMHWEAAKIGEAFALETGRPLKFFSQHAAAEQWLLAGQPIQ